MKQQGISDAIANPYNRVPQLPATTSLARTLNRYRQKTRPKHPTTLVDFEIEKSHVPPIFESWQYHVEQRYHIIWTSEEQRQLLKTSKTWYMDGTFKLVKLPFTQLYSIHCFISNGDGITKQIPVLFVLMSGRSSADYSGLITTIQDHLGDLAVEEIVMDFEASAWKAVREEFPHVRLRGCTFHWTQAVWRKVQNLGLQAAYTSDPATHTYIKKLLALPMLPSEHIPKVFEFLSADAVTEPLQQLVEYIQSTWIESNHFPPESWSAFFRSTRTNNDTEGWHSALNRKAGKSKLPLYLLCELLADEAKCVSLQMQLVCEGTLCRYQRKQYRKIQGRLIIGRNIY